MNVDLCTTIGIFCKVFRNILLMQIYNGNFKKFFNTIEGGIEIKTALFQNFRKRGNCFWICNFVGQSKLSRLITRTCEPFSQLNGFSDVVSSVENNNIVLLVYFHILWQNADYVICEPYNPIAWHGTHLIVFIVKYCRILT